VLHTNTEVVRQIIVIVCGVDRVGFLPWQKVFLPGQWKKTVKTGENRQKLQHTKLYRNTPIGVINEIF